MNLPLELMEGGSCLSSDVNVPSQSVEEVLSILQEARKPPNVPMVGDSLVTEGSMDFDDLLDADADADLDDLETSGEFVCPPL